jgi:hypothetical protein
MLSSLTSATGVFTLLCAPNEPDAPALIGQAAHTAGSSVAHCTFLAPDEAIESPNLPALLEGLTTCVGERGAQNLIAEVDEDSYTFVALRRSGFSIYARQRVWRISDLTSSATEEATWRPVALEDEHAARLLYNDLVPSMVRQIEPTPWDKLRGLVHYQDGELIAFCDLAHGPRGIWVQPYVHPENQRGEALLADLLEHTPPLPARPIYLCVRSYQGWLEHLLEDLGAQPGPRQAVMVKRLAVTKQAVRAVNLPQFERGRPEITTPTSMPGAGAVSDKMLLT